MTATGATGATGETGVKGGGIVQYKSYVSRYLLYEVESRLITYTHPWPALQDHDNLEGWYDTAHGMADLVGFGYL